MIKRIFMCLLLVWLAVAPAVASACAAECETALSTSSGDDNSMERHNSSQSSDCHGAQTNDQTNDTQTPDGSAMEAACFVAGAVSLPSTFVSVLAIDFDAERGSFILIPSASFETSPLIRPPQA